MIDTLAYTKALEAVGIDRSQAEAHAQAMKDHVLPQLATKADIVDLKHSLTIRFLGIIAAFNTLLFALLRLT